MSDVTPTPYIPFILFGMFVVSVFLWEWFQQYIRPLFVAKSEINKMTDDLIAKYGSDAEHHAYLEEDRAMRKTDTYQRGIWKRVRKELQRRYYASEWE